VTEQKAAEERVVAEEAPNIATGLDITKVGQAVVHAVCVNVVSCLSVSL